MKSQQESKKEALALELIKSERDYHFKRIDHATLSNRIQEINNEAKLNTWGTNEILSLAQANQEAYEKVLETKYNMPYARTSTKNTAQ